MVSKNEHMAEIGQKGGQVVHSTGRAHHFTATEQHKGSVAGGQVTSSDAAHMAEIGRKGGQKTSSDHKHMAEIGQKGGQKIATSAHMSTIGKKGRAARGNSGNSSGGTHQQHVEAGKLGGKVTAQHRKAVGR